MKDILRSATAGHYAIPAINIVNELTARAVVQAAEEMKSPVILQTSVGTVNQIGVDAIIGFLQLIAKRSSVPVAIHLDHCTSIEYVKMCIDKGWSSVMIDASHLPIVENIKATKEVVEYAISRDVSVEGELGLISGVEDNIVVSEAEAHLASIEESVKYVSETSVDAFAPAIGTAHGVYKNKPKIDFNRFKSIRKLIDVPLVVHGGTGLADDVFKELILTGASKINISTALKEAYCSSLSGFLKENPVSRNPLKLDNEAKNAVEEMTKSFIRLFSSGDKG